MAKLAYNRHAERSTTKLIRDLGLRHLILKKFLPSPRHFASKFLPATMALGKRWQIGITAQEPLPAACLDKPSVLFMPTNGAGLGHLTRAMAIARRMRRHRPDLEIVFLSTSMAIPLIFQEGFTSYYLPSKSSLPTEISPNQWNLLLRNQLQAILKLHNVRQLIFDGVYPYSGLTGVLQKADKMNKVWISRGGSRKIRAELQNRHHDTFDEIIIPGEAGVAESECPGSFTRVAPIINLDRDELLSRDRARTLLQAEKGDRIVYVQLGAGNINEISPTLTALLALLGKQSRIHLILGESIIGKRSERNIGKGLILRDYPNSRYFNAVDFAISAAGYNTFHELIYFGVPAIFIPNEETVTDDQLARAQRAVRAGAALLVRQNGNPDFELRLAQAIKQMLDEQQNLQFRLAARSLKFSNSAAMVANHLIRLAGC